MLLKCQTGCAIKIVLLIFFVVCFIGCGNTAGNAGRIFYVSTTGKNSNPGTKAMPWKTPGFASKKLRAGDTLIIMKGTYVMKEYWEDMITLEVSGKPNAWITIKGSDGTRPVIKGKNNLLAAIDIGGKQYVRIENLEITSLIDTPHSHGLREGIEAGGSYETGKGNVSNIVLKDLEIHHVEEGGINFSGNLNNVLVENVHIHHAGSGGIGAPSAGSGKGWRNMVISNCIIENIGLYSNGKENKSGWDRPDGIGFEKSEGPVEIKYVVSRNNFGDGIDSKSKNTYIHHCIVANNYGDGVKIWGGNSRLENTLIYGTGYPVPSEGTVWSLLIIDTQDANSNIEITNCTLFDDQRRASQHYVWGIQQEFNGVPITVTMKNNIIAGLHRGNTGSSVNLMASNNLFYNRADEEGIQIEFVDNKGNQEKIFTSQNINSLGHGNIYGDPKFIKAEWGPNGDFHLQNGSIAIDKGISNGAPLTDLENNKRPKGSGFDVGAYER